MNQWSDPAGQNPRPGSRAPSGDHGEMDLFDLLALAWSQRGLILVLFAVIFAVGVAASMTLLKPSYQAGLPLLVVLEDDPTPNTAGTGAEFQLDAIMQSEAEILASDAVLRRAVQEVGPAVLLNGEANSESLALRFLRTGFSVDRAPNASILNASFEAGDPDQAARALNAIVDAYLAYREDVLVGSGVAGIVEQRARASEAYDAALSQLNAYLVANGISNFDADKLAAETRVSTIQDRLISARADRDAARAAVAALNRRLAEIPQSVELYVENGVSGVLLERRAERANLLARYQPTAPAVQAVDREIAAIEDFIASGAADGLGQRRVGINPIYQAMETDRAAREATALAEAGRVTALDDQLISARNEVARLRQLEPEFVRLSQDVNAYAQTTGRLAGLEAAAETRTAMAGGVADTIRVFDRAQPPVEGSSLKKLGLVASFVLAAGVSLFVGLVRGYVKTYLPGPPVRVSPSSQRAGSSQGRAMDQAAPGQAEAPTAAAHPRPQVAAAAAMSAPPPMAPHPVSRPVPTAAQAALADLPVVARIRER